MTNQNEQLLISKVLAGDTRAFGELVEKYQQMAYTLAVRIMKDPADAEDVVQEAFIKSYEVLNTFRGDSKFSTWLYRIVYHKALDRIKSQKRRYAESFDDVKESQIRADKVEDAYDLLTKKEQKQLVLEAISKLPEEEQTLLMLYYFEEESIKEIALILDISMDNVKVKLFRCRKKLYELLKGQSHNLAV
ncbi:RNA polymerase sigma factor [Robertkochia aurantiaca]|uniref:RNA polymerase sigma factor n=1 Tax=Robertkochia aurantiaca TaxID=2873700 RepID=UPI001CCC1DE9|nr:RNA polymerase sigma factor [Robertkochia sp. 3YJGBD-33]